MADKDYKPALRRILNEHLGGYTPEEKITDDAHLVDDLGADSLDVVEIVMAVEEETGAYIPDDAAEKLMTINDMDDWLRQNVSK